MASAEIYHYWLKHDGKTVKIDGILHVLKVSTYKAIFPSAHQVITVHAEVKDKSTKYYQDIRAELHDDWSTDILDSDVEIQAHVLQQLEEEVACDTN